MNLLRIQANSVVWILLVEQTKAIELQPRDRCEHSERRFPRQFVRLRRRISRAQHNASDTLTMPNATDDCNANIQQPMKAHQSTTNLMRSPLSSPNKLILATMSTTPALSPNTNPLLPQTRLLDGSLERRAPQNNCAHSCQSPQTPLNFTNRS